MKEKGYSISDISRLLGKDRRTISRYISGNPNNLCKDTRKRYNPYEDKIINLIKSGYIEKQIINILISEGYKLSISNARHMIRKVVKDNNLNINKYSPVINSVNTSNKSSDIKYTYITRNLIFKHIWMDYEISENEKKHLYVTYPKIFKLKKCIIEFREIFERKGLTLLSIFIDKCKEINIPEVASFAKGLLKDLDAIENAVSSNLSNSFVEGTNSKLKMIKRTMYGRASKKLLASKLMLYLNG